jgi:hypothetical protein
LRTSGFTSRRSSMTGTTGYDCIRRRDIVYQRNLKK